MIEEYCNLIWLRAFYALTGETEKRMFPRQDVFAES